jgi:hypothetical protein
MLANLIAIEGEGGRKKIVGNLNYVQRGDQEYNTI